MEKLTYAELKEKMVQHNVDNNISVKGADKNPLVGVIVFDPKKSNWKEEFLDCSLEEKSYVISSDNKAFIPGMCGYSIFSYNITKTDFGVRLEQLMSEECGDESGWVVDYCYLR